MIGSGMPISQSNAPFPKPTHLRILSRCHLLFMVMDLLCGLRTQPFIQVTLSDADLGIHQTII